MTTQERQPSEGTMREESLEVVQTVEKDLQPAEQLLIKCKDDWIHHLAQTLSFSLLAALVPIAVLLLTLFLLLGAEVNAFFAEGIHVPKSDLITQASRGGYE